MGEVKDYDCDIFISYSHHDNYPLVGSNQGWVTQFHQALENWLKHRRGFNRLIIWRDKELQGNTRFDTAIEKRINDSALFFVLHSKNYINSDYCRKELDWFFQHNKHRTGGLNIGEHSRIFHILLNNFAFENWPKQLAGTSGFAMHDAEDTDSLGDFTAPNDTLFQSQLRQIIDAVQSTLEKMINNSASAQQNPRKDPQSISVFLADTTDSQASLRKRLTTDLQQLGCEVISNVPPPYGFEEHKARLDEILQQAQLSIHLLDRFPGRDVQDQENTSYPCAQVEAGFSGNTKQIIWLPTEIDPLQIEDTGYKDWVLQLDKGDRTGKHYDFVRSSQAAMLDMLHQEISALQQNRQAKIAVQTFLIDTHQKDQQYAYQLAGIMAEKGINVDFNKESHDPIESLSLFEKNIASISNLIIMFGLVSPNWLAGRIKQVVKTFAAQYDQENSLQLENIWIFLTPDSQGQSSLPSLPRLIPVTLLDNSSTASIDPSIIESLWDSAQ